MIYRTNEGQEYISIHPQIATINLSVMQGSWRFPYLEKI